MTKRLAVVVVALVLSGCVAEVEEPVAVPERTKLDCDLIFPAPVPTTPADSVVP